MIREFNDDNLERVTQLEMRALEVAIATEPQMKGVKDCTRERGKYLLVRRAADGRALTVIHLEKRVNAEGTKAAYKVDRDLLRAFRELIMLRAAPRTESEQVH